MKITLQELSAPGCVHCAEFERFWHSIEKDFPNVEYKKIDITTPEGTDLVRKHMIFASPGIVINDEVFSTGGINKDKFVAKLKELSEKN
ncbi:MAG: thioredoxin family protein [Patescibacteria group bacterium]